jgi:membrane-associated phospholipid phosphatase
MKRLIFAVSVLMAGVAIHMLALFITDRAIASFPSVPDLLMDRLPRVDFGVTGELFFVAILIFFAVTFFRQPKHDTARLLIALGMFYALRGLFLFFLPIGMPFGAAPPEERFTFYPYGTHAFFPGGHFGILTIMALSLTDRRARILMMAAVVVFGLGTVLAKTHYTADLLGGGLFAYLIVKKNPPRE